jgi:DNA-binding transcriptional regulator YhcF (GntR family)
MIRKEIHYRSNLISSKAYTRIYSVIFESTKFPNQTNAPSPVLSIENLPNQQTIASMANVSRETVSRALQALIKAGIIKKETKTIFIKNPILLEQLAKGEISMSQIKINHSIKNPTIDPL